MNIDHAINQMMTCATAHVCPREESCFEVVKWARDRRKEELRKEGIDRALQRIQGVNDVADYAPHFPSQVAWECARATDVDWSAA